MNLKAPRQKPRIGISSHAHVPRQFILEPFNRVRELDGRGLVHVGNIDATVAFGGHGDAYNLGIVSANLKVQMWEEVCVAPLHFAENRILVLKVANVSPHGEILDEHFKEPTVMNGLFEFSQLLLAQSGFAQKAPFDIVLETELVGGSFATVAHNGLAEALLVTFGSDAISHNSAAESGRSVQLSIHAVNAHGNFFLIGGLVFFMVCVDAAEGEGVVTVGLGGIVEGSEMMIRQRGNVGHVRSENNYIPFI